LTTTGATLALPSLPGKAATPATEALGDWGTVRAQFQLSPDYIHLALMLLTSHPKPVREAIERHRRGLDENPIDYFEERFMKVEQEVRRAAARYLGGDANDVALTDSTTMGLGILYGGLRLGPGQEVLTTTHDHYATHENLRLRAARTGGPGAPALMRKIALYDQPDQVSTQEVVTRLIKEVRPQTRVVAVTWVHSSTGVKLPVAAIGAALAKLNARRGANDKVIFCVDGVHGLGVESEKPSDLGCDFFVAGCHKWMFGPRGTGVLWGRPAAWKEHVGLIAPFEEAPYKAWMKGAVPAAPGGILATPGGFHSFEHRWSLGEAFAFHERIGRARITQRIHALATQCKEGLARLPHVSLQTPMSSALSSALVCFEVRGVPADEVVKRLHARKIIASVTPYAAAYARFSPGILNTPEDIEAAVREIRAMG
jgi:isopenicillin-N epimerase